MSGPQKRYVLHPGHVRSRNDGQTHFISAPMLAELYGVPLWKCAIVRDSRPEFMAGFIERPGDVHLYPRSDGDYSLAAAEAENETDQGEP